MPHATTNHRRSLRRGILLTTTAASIITLSSAFVVSQSSIPRRTIMLSSSKNNNNNNNNPDWSDPSNDPNQWLSADDEAAATQYEAQQGQEDWQDLLERKNDGSFWTAYSSQVDDEAAAAAVNEQEEPQPQPQEEEPVDEADAWLETLAKISAEEIEFNLQEADRADKVRQMQEWGFDDSTIANTLNVAVDSRLEKEVVEGMQIYREQAYLDDEDWKEVESHTKVEKDEETGEPVRQQMVYVDEHTCIGCTNCAMIAQSTFFMQDEHGRARVFNQWGDDDETIAVAIETCPVDCIHYVPYDELVRLEIDRRNQNINFKARLVSQGEYGNSLSHRVGGANTFTAPQKISGNMGSRCNNCPSRGCKTCPMFGVGENPEFQRKEKERLARLERARLKQLREDEKKSADL